MSESSLKDAIVEDLGFQIIEVHLKLAALKKALAAAKNPILFSSRATIEAHVSSHWEGESPVDLVVSAEESPKEALERAKAVFMTSNGRSDVQGECIVFIAFDVGNGGVRVRVPQEYL